jgi:integrase
MPFNVGMRCRQASVEVTAIPGIDGTTDHLDVLLRHRLLPQLGGFEGFGPTHVLEPLPDSDRALWAVAFYAGLRRGEIQALRVCDVDLGASLIRVERGWDQVEGVIEPKSAAGRRTVPLLAVLRDHLDEHLLRIGRTGEELVFGRTLMKPFAPSTIDNRAQECWAAAELEPISLHEARHTFASLLIDSGANAKAVQEFMGHAKVQTTFDVYGHLLPGSHDEVRERMDAYLAEPEEIDDLDAAEDAV